MKQLNVSMFRLPRFNQVITLILLYILIPGFQTWGATPEESLTREEATGLIREVAQATELAWEEFHAAAIGGTLASPLTQVTIERQLHEARNLLMKARMARREGKYKSVREITHEIQAITKQIIKASKERKQ